MSIFSRYFAPEIESLRIQLNEFARRENALLAQNSKLELKLAVSEAARAEEIKATRIREGEFINRLLRLANVAPVPVSETSLTTPAAAPISETAEELLERRAADYCAATFGEDYTKDDLDAVIARMKDDADYWLND